MNGKPSRVLFPASTPAILLYKYTHIAPGARFRRRSRKGDHVRIGEKWNCARDLRKTCPLCPLPGNTQWSFFNQYVLNGRSRDFRSRVDALI
jgi:hypothetical protein